MIDELSIVETDKVIHTVETDMVKLVVEIEYFGKSFDEFNKGTGTDKAKITKKGKNRTNMKTGNGRARKDPGESYQSQTVVNL
ncbi:hypothetical protein Tco_0055485 [Tanacetum coccineum]